jgi:FkbM family methyltransferase
MTVALPPPIRSLGLIVLHRWQHFYDLSRGKWREFSFRSEWVDFQDRRRALKRATPILEDVQRIRFVLYPWDRPNLLYLLRHPHDVAEFQAIPRLVQPGDTAFDIGANIGIYSVLLSRLCGPTGRVWAFEPVPDTYWRLRETLALNRCENVIPAQSAICEESGSVRMNLFEPQFSEWNTLGMPTMRALDGSPILPSQSVEVPAHALDQFCDAERIERINFLKVDVEGFELSVFRGARRLLQERRVDYICFEISKEPLKGAGIKSRRVFEALETRGYFAYRFDNMTGAFQGPVQDTSEYWTNFFASCKDLSKIDETKKLDSVRVHHLADAKESADVNKVSSGMAAPIVTVLINAYNYGRFIEEAIDSVLSQDFPMDKVEILVVDDGSTDDTAERVKKYGSRIQYFYKPNGGQGSALNFGLQHTRGELIALLDADDYFVPGKLRRIAEEFQSHPDVGMIYHPSLVLDVRTGHVQQCDFVAVSGFLPDDLGKLRAYRHTSTSCLAFRREALGRILPMPESFRFLADTYIASLIPLVTPVLAVVEALTIYRVHGGNQFSKITPLTEEEKHQRIDILGTIGKEVKAWIGRHKWDVKQPETRLYFAEWFLAMEETQFLLRPPSRFGFFSFLVRQNHAYRSAQTWKLTAYNYAAALAAPLFGYKNRHLMFEWRGRTMTVLQSLFRRSRSTHTKMKAPDVKA